ncbi:MAG: TrmH family RNA methyltransferase [SAR324 cluster bacterium]|nr:TrmH family RNA methyltransferase [SAR324 cluster bacterium]
MQDFAFSDKKIAGLTPKRQAKHVALWLRRCYLQVLGSQNAQEYESEKAVELDFEKLKTTYEHIHELITCPKFEWPDSERQKPWLEFLSNQYHQWLVRADVKLFEKDFLPHVPWGDQLQTGPWVPAFDYFVALDQIRSAFNVGSIARTIDALGFAGLITWGITPLLINPKVKKSSMGAESWIPEMRVESLKEELIRLQVEGYQIIALEKAEGAVTLDQVEWPQKAVLLLGNEEYGIAEELLSLVDLMVELPMQGRKNSINVANAFSVVGFTAMMQLKAGLC